MGTSSILGPKEAAIDGAGGGRQDLNEYESKSDGEFTENVEYGCYS